MSAQARAQAAEVVGCLECLPELMVVEGQPLDVGDRQFEVLGQVLVVLAQLRVVPYEVVVGARGPG